MTAIIAIKDGKRIMVGADGVTSTDTDAWNCYNQDHFKVQRIDGSPNCIIACTGDVDRNYVISRIKNLLDGKSDVNYSYIVNRVLPKIYNALKERNLLTEDDNRIMLGSGFIIASKSHLYRISSYGIVTEHERIACCGSGEDQLALKYLDIKDKNLDIKEIIKECLKHTIKYGQTIGYPIVIYDNAEQSYIIDE